MVKIKEKFKEGYLLAKRKYREIPNIPEWVSYHRPKIRDERVYDPPEAQEYAGKKALVVGAYGDLGEEIAYRLLLHGCEWIFLASDREDELDNMSKRFQHDARLRSVNPDYQVCWLPLDLRHSDGVINFIHRFLARSNRLHIIIFNAATFHPDYQAILVANNMYTERTIQGISLSSSTVTAC
ncbi:hypothetical protein P170DRAFT_250334 [Aspergillus steynii IBT 23096]|uniref:NAD(P)-binding protein n=1 Tax=Aspergillus steynii IBT 23096 TaxID=1392250 RepID=A0A2I2FYJ6_9EURO|nr:uncharacterized protein P170DRAFT_250334 [Aspergillus steynii IBT 23096]PLB45711.1 hypothetical protein P170DRAFT_250334 [Aspergillus steynii IBT 23096]